MWFQGIVGQCGAGNVDGTPRNRLAIVSTGKWRSCTTRVAATIATNGPGTSREILGHTIRIASVNSATSSVVPFTVLRPSQYATHLSIRSGGTVPIFNPKKSLISFEKMITAMPDVNP